MLFAHTLWQELTAAAAVMTQRWRHCQAFSKTWLLRPQNTHAGLSNVWCSCPNTPPPCPCAEHQPCLLSTYLVGGILVVGVGWLLRGHLVYQ
jgi:hypothetical protein